MSMRSLSASIYAVALAWSLRPALAQSFDSHTRTVNVGPSGTDDTLAIATAFDICLAVGPGCTVQLSEGTFFTRQQDVAGFRGTFAGAGMEATVIEPITPFRVSPERVDVSSRAPDPGGAPVMFTFRDTDVTVRDLGFVVREPAPSEPWFFGELEIRALAVILSFEGLHVRDSRISGPLSGIALGDLEASTVIVACPPAIAASECSWGTRVPLPPSTPS